LTEYKNKLPSEVKKLMTSEVIHIQRWGRKTRLQRNNRPKVLKTPKTGVSRPEANNTRAMFKNREEKNLR